MERLKCVGKSVIFMVNQQRMQQALNLLKCRQLFLLYGNL